MISRSFINYSLEYCRGASYATFISSVRNKGTLTRLCYLGVDNLRAYLSLERGTPRLDFFRRAEKTWERITRIPRERPLDIERMLHDSQAFENELAETFFFAYPRAEESYYESMPNHKDILATLRSNPTDIGAKNLRLICSYDDVTGVDEADGVVTITCDDGRICIPYDVHSGYKSFQMDRAMFHADSKVSALSDSLFDRCYTISSRLRSLTFSGVMSKIENLMP